MFTPLSTWVWVCQSIDVVWDWDPGEEKRDKKENAEARIRRGPGYY